MGKKATFDIIMDIKRDGINDPGPVSSNLCIRSLSPVDRDLGKGS